MQRCTVKARIQKWITSLALRFSQTFADSGPILTLDDLLAGVTAHNVHGEVDTGDIVGKEAW